jgi:hypothetical protein
MIFKILNRPFDRSTDRLGNHDCTLIQNQNLSIEPNHFL